MKRHPPPTMWPQPPRQRVRMNVKTACMLLGICGTLVLLPGWTQQAPETYETATTQALERLIRTTRRGGEAREPVILEEGTADLRLVAPVNDDLEQAILLMQEKDYAAAIPLLESSLKDQPTYEPIWEALGWCYHNTGRSAEAEALWQQYLTLRPESPKAYSLLAQMAILRSDWQAADRYLSGSLRYDPDSYDVRFWYAQNLSGWDGWTLLPRPWRNSLPRMNTGSMSKWIWPGSIPCCNVMKIPWRCGLGSLKKFPATSPSALNTHRP